MSVCCRNSCQEPCRLLVHVSERHFRFGRLAVKNKWCGFPNQLSSQHPRRVGTFPVNQVARNGHRTLLHLRYQLHHRDPYTLYGTVSPLHIDTNRCGLALVSLLQLQELMQLIKVGKLQCFLLVAMESHSVWLQRASLKWHVASISVLSNGKKLGTVYLANTPQSNQEDLSRNLTSLLTEVVRVCGSDLPKIVSWPMPARLKQPTGRMYFASSSLSITTMPANA